MMKRKRGKATPKRSLKNKIKKNNPFKIRAQNLEKVLAVNARINSTLDTDELLGIIMKTSAEVMRSETASLLLLDPKTKELVFRVALGEKGGELKEKFRIQVGEGIAGTVALTGKPLIVNDVRKDKRFAKRFDNSTGFVTKAILCVPLKAKGKITGVLQAINPRGRVSFSKDDLSLFEIFSDQAALALENARLHEAMIKEEKALRELAIAHEIQQNFLPDLTAIKVPMAVAAKSIPARHVGGDFYDVIAISESQTAVILGDVSGKGVPAALYMVRAISEYRYLAPQTTSPAKLLERLNSALSRDNTRGMFITMACLLIDHDKKKISYSLAGHLPLIQRKKEGSVIVLPEAGGLPVGISEGSYAEHSLDVQSGDIFFSYTDGVTEARNKKGGDYTLMRLEAAIRQSRAEAQKSVDDIFADLLRFADGAEPHDDTTLLAMEIR